MYSRQEVRTYIRYEDITLCGSVCLALSCHVLSCLVCGSVCVCGSVREGVCVCVAVCVW